MTEATPPAAPSTDLLLYRTEDGRDRIEVRLHDETVWLTQAQMAELFETSVPNINQHLGHIYAEGELDPRATIQDYLIVRNEGSMQVSEAAHRDSLEAIRGVAPALARAEHFQAGRIAQDDARAALDHDAELRAIEDRAARAPATAAPPHRDRDDQP